MKITDFMPDPDKAHTEFNFKPPMQADLDKLKAMYDLLMHNIPLARNGINSINPINNDKTTSLGLITLIEIGPEAFYGVTFCPNCARIAVTALRDAAQALEDLIEFATTSVDKPPGPA